MAADLCEGLPELAEVDFPAQFAATLCAQQRDCGCDTTFACEGIVKDAFASIQTYAQAQGFVYDGDCAARQLVGLVEQFGCLKVSEKVVKARARACDTGCYVYRGVVDVGAGCTTPSTELAPFVSECAEPARCNANQCSLWFENHLDVGEPCSSTNDGLFKFLGECKVGTVCDIFASNVCVPIVMNGETCDSPPVCEPVDWCGPSAVCVPRKAAGEPCESILECASFRCVEQVCDDPVWICGIGGPGDLIR